MNPRGRTVYLGLAPRPAARFSRRVLALTPNSQAARFLDVPPVTIKKHAADDPIARLAYHAWSVVGELVEPSADLAPNQRGDLYHQTIERGLTRAGDAATAVLRPQTWRGLALFRR